ASSSLAAKRAFRAAAKRILGPRLFGWFAKRRAATRTLNEERALVLESGLFDANWYLARYSDVASAGVDPLVHFLRHGGRERRDPGPGFSTSWYLDKYLDVRRARMNALVHYLRFGRQEGRFPLRPDFVAAPAPLPSPDADGMLEKFSDGIVTGWAL